MEMIVVNQELCEKLRFLSIYGSIINDSDLHPGVDVSEYITKVDTIKNQLQTMFGYESLQRIQIVLKPLCQWIANYGISGVDIINQGIEYAQQRALERLRKAMLQEILNHISLYLMEIIIVNQELCGKLQILNDYSMSPVNNELQTMFSPEEFKSIQIVLKPLCQWIANYGISDLDMNQGIEYARQQAVGRLKDQAEALEKGKVPHSL